MSVRTLEMRQAETDRLRAEAMPYVTEAAHLLVAEGVLSSPALSDTESRAVSAMVAGLSANREDRDEDELRWDIIQAPVRKRRGVSIDERHLALNQLKTMAIGLRELDQQD